VPPLLRPVEREFEQVGNARVRRIAALREARVNSGALREQIDGAAQTDRNRTLRYPGAALRQNEKQPAEWQAVDLFGRGGCIGDYLR